MGNGYIVSVGEIQPTAPSNKHSLTSLSAPHLHDGALNLKLMVNGNVACQADAIYGQDGGTSVGGEKWETITSYTECKEPIKVKYGDKVKITSDYDVRRHKLYVERFLKIMFQCANGFPGGPAPKTTAWKRKQWQLRSSSSQNQHDESKQLVCSTWFPATCDIPPEKPRSQCGGNMEEFEQGGLLLDHCCN
jgi:hypothetical protein